MYECIRCGHRRNRLSPRIGDKFKFGREDYVEGASSWCNLCSELTFFIKRKIDRNSISLLFRNTVDLTESASTSRKSLDIQNSPDPSMAKQHKNWAVEAVDPPKSWASYTILPNRHGYLNRNLQIPLDIDAPPPVTPLNVLLNSSPPPQTDNKILRNSIPVKKTPVKASEMTPRNARSPKVKGIELLRSTPPKHLSPELPLAPDRRLLPVNPYKMTHKHSDDQLQKSGTSNKKVKGAELYMGSSGPSSTLKDIKKRYAADDSEPGTSRQSNHVQSIPRSQGSVLNSSRIMSQKKLTEKRRQMRKLALMRSRLKYQTTQTELDDMEHRNHQSPTGRSKRKCGGAHISLSQLVVNTQVGKPIEESWKLSTEQYYETILKVLGEDNVPFVNENTSVKDHKSLESLKPVDTPLATETDTEMENVPESVLNSDLSSETEILLNNTSSTACESVRTNTTYIPLPCQLKNPFASPANVGYFMPTAYHAKDNFKESQPSVRSPRICSLVSSAQRALFARVVNDPLDVVRLIQSMDEFTEVTLNAPRAQFSTIACAETELLCLIEKKPYMTGIERAKELDVSRSPIRCPDYDCQRLCFVSDFNTHMLLDHRSLTVERIKTRQTKTFFLDINMTLLDKAKCHMVYMVRDKIIDTQAEDLNDLLPVMVMSGRTHVSKCFGCPELSATGDLSRHKPASDIEIFVIWLTGLIPRDIQPLATISLWSTLGPKMADCVSANTGYIYDIRAPSDVAQIARSRCSMILPMSMISQMTQNARRFLAVQVQVY